MHEIIDCRYSPFFFTHLDVWTSISSRPIPVEMAVLEQKNKTLTEDLTGVTKRRGLFYSQSPELN